MTSNTAEQDPDEPYRRVLISYWVVAVLIWPLIAGLLYSDVQRYCQDKRMDTGAVLALSFPLAGVWPLGLPFAYLITGFAERGVWHGCDRD